MTVLAADDLTPVDADVTVAGRMLEHDESGRAIVEWHDAPLELTIGAQGFHPATFPIVVLPVGLETEVRLDPVVLNGTVVTPDGRALPAATVTLGGEETTTNKNGRFSFVRAHGSELVLTRPAWEPQTVVWDGTEERMEISMQPRMIRALRVGGDKPGDPAVWDHLLDLAGESGVNAFVIDTKDEGGTIFWDMELALAHEVGAVDVRYDIDQVIADMDELDLYKITRITTFQDDFLPRAQPELAARNKNTGRPWENNNGVTWLDATDPASWDYPLAVAQEACRRGFDEIQFDYVRFPSDGDISVLEFDELTSDAYYSEPKQQRRIETISAFLEKAHGLLNPMGCAVAADIFAITLGSPSDEGIGQQPGPLSSHVDVLSPMIYSYTYPPGWGGYDDPNEHVEELVTNTLDAGIPKLEGFSIYRPWLQRAFITDDEILSIQQIAEDRDMGWMLWSANTVFDLGHLPPVIDR